MDASSSASRPYVKTENEKTVPISIVETGDITECNQSFKQNRNIDI